jgi:hypothetical protein
MGLMPWILGRRNPLAANIVSGLHVQGQDMCDHHRSILDEVQLQMIRISIRRLMAIVLVFALILALAIPAVEVYQTKEPHVHMGIDMQGTPSLASWGGIEPPFWPRYLRRLAGRPWRRHPDCGFRTGYEADRCEFAYPEMALKIGNRVAYHFDSDQAKRLEAILKQRAHAKK